jgi:uncharacterized protein (TIGR02231 family)
VVLFQDGAQVTREGRITLGTSPCSVTIGGLPASVDLQSIRVQVTGPGKILNMTIQNSLKNEDAGLASELAEKLKGLTLELTKLEDILATKEIALAQYRQSLAASTAKFALFSATGKAGFETFSELDSTLSSKIEETIDQITEWQGTKRKLLKEQAACQEDLDGIKAQQGVIDMINIVLEVELESADEFEFVLTYMFKSGMAKWEPFYELYIQEDSLECAMIMYAMATNSTGEDWNDITLAMSTASIKPASIKEPTPIIVHGTKQTATAQPKTTSPAGPRSVADLDADAAAEAALREGLGVQVYEIPDKTTITSSKGFKQFYLEEFTLETSMELFWSSPQGEMVLEFNTIENTNQVFLPGVMRAYIDDEFSGESTIDLVRPFEQFKTSPRESKIVKIRKDLVDRGRKQVTTVVKDRVVKHYGYVIKVNLIAGVDARLVIMDAIPVSEATGKISVSDLRFSKAPLRNENGVLTWELETKTMQKTVKIEYQYNVLTNKGIEVSPRLP